MTARRTASAGGPRDRQPGLSLCHDPGPFTGTDVYAVPLHDVPRTAGSPHRPGAGADRIDVDLPRWVAQSGAEATAGALTVLPMPGGSPRAAYLVGVGAGSPAELRTAAASLVRAVDPRHGVRRLVTTLASGIDADGVRAIVEGLRLGGYRFSQASTTPKPVLAQVDLVVDDPAGLGAAQAAGEITAAAICWARDLSNMPPDIKSPAWLARQATTTLLGPDLTVAVREPAQLEEFGGILAVGGGSSRPPRLIEVRYRPRGAGGKHVVLIGKGITFDTGGISIKPNEGMHLMKTDMAGGAAVLATVWAAAALRLPVRVTVLVPAAENHVSGSAYRPGDVVRHFGGRTTEVRNTDAEGRMVLADALAYAAAKLRPDVLIDVATLTGAMKLALGVHTGGLLGSDPALTAELLTAAAEAGERLWQLPLVEDYAALIDSPIADANNAAGNPGGITAALFLRPFAAGLPWAHLDIAGPARANADDGAISRGGSGFGVRTLLRYLERQLDD